MNDRWNGDEITQGTGGCAQRNIVFPGESFQARQTKAGLRGTQSRHRFEVLPGQLLGDVGQRVDPALISHLRIASHSDRCVSGALPNSRSIRVQHLTVFVLLE